MIFSFGSLIVNIVNIIVNLFNLIPFTILTIMIIREPIVKIDEIDNNNKW